MSSTSSSCVQPAGGVLVRAEAHVVAVGRVPDRDAVAPPQLAADAPVAQVVDPLEVARRQRRPARSRSDRRAPRRRPPWPASRRAPTTAATAAARSSCRSASSARPRAGTDASRRRCGRPRAARRRSRTAPRAGRGRANGPGAVMTAALVHDRRHRQVVAAADLEVVRVVRRRHLHRAGAEGRVDVLVGDDRDARGWSAAARPRCRSGAGSARRRGARRPRCRRASSRRASWPPRSSASPSP